MNIHSPVQVTRINNNLKRHNKALWTSPVNHSPVFYQEAVNKVLNMLFSSFSGELVVDRVTAFKDEMKICFILGHQKLNRLSPNKKIAKQIPTQSKHVAVLSCQGEGLSACRLFNGLCEVTLCPPLCQVCWKMSVWPAPIRRKPSHVRSRIYKVSL